MNDKLLNILFGLCLVAVIGVMSWRDMHPAPAPVRPSNLMAVTYYVAEKLSLDLIPKDNSPLMMAQGTFTYARDGKMTWARKGMEPALFPQRQLALVFHFNDLPHNPAETLQAIDKTIEEWEHLGNNVSTLYLEYTPHAPDLKTYAAFFKAAHTKFKNNQTLIASAQPEWTTGEMKEKFSPLLDLSPQFLIPFPAAGASPSFMAQLESFPYRPLVIVPASVSADEKLLQQFPGKVALILTLSPDRPLPQKQVKVGLFPKF